MKSDQFFRATSATETIVGKRSQGANVDVPVIRGTVDRFELVTPPQVGEMLVDFVLINGSAWIRAKKSGSMQHLVIADAIIISGGDGATPREVVVGSPNGKMIAWSTEKVHNDLRKGDQEVADEYKRLSLAEAERIQLAIAVLATGDQMILNGGIHSEGDPLPGYVKEVVGDKPEDWYSTEVPVPLEPTPEEILASEEEEKAAAAEEEKETSP